MMQWLERRWVCPLAVAGGRADTARLNGLIANPQTIEASSEFGDDDDLVKVRGWFSLNPTRSEAFGLGGESGAAQVRALQVRALQVRALQVRALQVRAPQVRARQVRARQVRALRSAPVRFAPVRSAPVRFAPLRSADHRNAPVRFAPLRSAFRNEAACSLYFGSCRRPR